MKIFSQGKFRKNRNLCGKPTLIFTFIPIRDLKSQVGRWKEDIVVKFGVG